MRVSAGPSRPKRQTSEACENLAVQLASRIIGQPGAVRQIIPYVEMFRAGLAPEGRPVGVFLLLGPTGTGKTRTVEALAEVIHGHDRNLLRIDCGEYQMDHEVAKLIGAPPGYLGHRETQPMLNQQRLNAATSERSPLSLVLFDEIEKAAPSLARLLLGILDRATLRLGDNSSVNFETSLIFLTSNLGAREMMRELDPGIGFEAGVRRPRPDLLRKLESIALGAVRRMFSPEFVNRIDVVISYQPLDTEALAVILDQQVAELQRHINYRLGERAFVLDLAPEGREWLLGRGTSPEHGARELKRTLQRSLMQPLAALVAAGKIDPGSRVRVEPDPARDGLLLRVRGAGILDRLPGSWGRPSAGPPASQTACAPMVEPEPAAAEAVPSPH